MQTHEVQADEVQVGDFLPHLDNGYVVDTGDATYEVCWAGHGGAFPDSMTIITFHDAEGTENYLILVNDHPVTVER